MNTRERFHAAVNFQPFDRLPILEWACWWDKTIERWHSEGLPENITDRYDISRYFGLDIYYQHWIQAIGSEAPKPESHGAGIIKNEDDYESLVNYLYPLDFDCSSLAEQAKEQESGDSVIWFTMDGFFWFPRKLFGIENHLFAFYDQPKLMHLINSTIALWMIKAIDRLCEHCTPDFMTFAEDMSYNNGPMLSKDLFDEFMKPYYDIVVPHLKKKGIRVIVDSDGDISTAAQWFKDAGIEGILPLERQAGCDIAQLRSDNPDTIWIGHFDKMTMSQGEDAMRQEFERLLPTAAKGGFLISCDHQTPPEVSFENYKIYLELFKEYAEKAGKLSRGEQK